MKAECRVCCHHCRLEEGQAGACGARRNTGGRIIASNYGRLTALALDPIEKKPLARFYPGSRILSVGSYGCSLRCPFCQNYEIATAREKTDLSAGTKPGQTVLERADQGAAGKPGSSAAGQKGSAGEPGSSAAGRNETRKSGPGTDGRKGSPEGPGEVVCLKNGRPSPVETALYSPQELCDLALGLRDRGNIGIAFTYNEPLVGWEFVRDTAKLFHQNGMKTVLVTNGMASGEVLEELLPLIDAMNIDLKGFSDAFYRDFVGGDLQMVKDFIAAAAGSCHVELTKLIIPDRNDSEEEMRAMAAWIASLRGGRGREIPLHVSRYFPRYRWTAPATGVDTVYRLARIAGETLDHVYTGNC